jgi:hypothetical protein
MDSDVYWAHMITNVPYLTSRPLRNDPEFERHHQPARTEAVQALRMAAPKPPRRRRALALSREHGLRKHGVCLPQARHSVQATTTNNNNNTRQHVTRYESSSRRDPFLPATDLVAMSEWNLNTVRVERTFGSTMMRSA